MLITSDNVCKLSAIGRGHVVSGKDSDLLALSRWQAPEVIRKGIASIKSDVWSFGVTFWEILTFAGTPYPDSTSLCFAFSDNSLDKVPDERLLAAIEGGTRPERPPGCPQVISDILSTCWHSDAKLRSVRNVHFPLFFADKPADIFLFDQPP